MGHPLQDLQTAMHFQWHNLFWRVSSNLGSKDLQTYKSKYLKRFITEEKLQHLKQQVCLREYDSKQLSIILARVCYSQGFCSMSDKDRAGGSFAASTAIASLCSLVSTT
jgi:hypothetical protein